MTQRGIRAKQDCTERMKQEPYRWNQKTRNNTL